MVFSPNDSPLAGRDGTQMTGSKIGERLLAEAATSVSLRVAPLPGGGESFEVQARGELQLGLLMGEQQHMVPYCSSTAPHMGCAVLVCVSELNVSRQSRCLTACHGRCRGHEEGRLRVLGVPAEGRHEVRSQRDFPRPSTPQQGCKTCGCEDTQQHMVRALVDADRKARRSWNR